MLFQKYFHLAYFMSKKTTDAEKTILYLWARSAIIEALKRFRIVSNWSVFEKSIEKKKGFSDSRCALGIAITRV